MGPFVPDIISDELNLIVALVLGIAFGVVLEQAGFSSSRKLAGVFYGYDFTVLRVFFTAGVTAAVGVVILSAFGLLDAEMIYVNPMFLGPAIVGGVIMGFGFVIGGYCPGTGVCAAAIGKKDAIAFVAGGVLGVFVFGELFPLYESFYTSGDMGALKVYDALGISQGLFLLALIVIAVAAFVVTTRIERKVNPSSSTADKSWPAVRHAIAGMAIVIVGVAIVFLPDRKTALVQDATSAAFRQEHPVRLISSDELAFRILDRDPRLVIVDFRSGDEFKALALPGSVNFPFDGLFRKESNSLLGIRHKEHVFVDKDGAVSDSAALVAAHLGFENIRVLQGGISDMQAAILNFQQPAGKATPDLADTYHFRAKARELLAKMIDENKSASNRPKPAVKKIQGGC